MAFRRRGGDQQPSEPVFDPAKIDFLSLSPDGAEVRLYIVELPSWSGSDRQLDSLQAKIHNYVGFALDGQMLALHPETAGLRWRIVIDSTQVQPDARTVAVIDEVAERVRSYGGDLVFQ